MTTILDATQNEILIKIGGNLRPHQQQERRLFAIPEVTRWMDQVLRHAATDGFVDGALRPAHQVMILANQFVSGANLPPPFPHSMYPEHLGIYRIRTHDVRLDGWFPERQCFIIGEIELKSVCIETPGRDDEMRDNCVAHRERLNINGGAFLSGDYNDHI